MENKPPLPPIVPGRVLAFDASSTHVGWCWGDGDQISESGVLVITGDADARVKKIIGQTGYLMARIRPETVVIEEPTGNHGNLHTDRLLARVCGAVECAALMLSVRHVWYMHPLKVKKTGYSKDNLSIVRAAFCKPSMGPDEADAIGIFYAQISAERQAAATRQARNAGNQKTGAKKSKGAK